MTNSDQDENLLRESFRMLWRFWSDQNRRVPDTKDYQLEELLRKLRDRTGGEDSPWWGQPPVQVQKPIDMVLYCPKCGKQHIDRDETPSDREWSALSAGDREVQYWTNPPHCTHLCHDCGCKWRPADVPTNGVWATQTHGRNDTWPPEMEWANKAAV